MRKEGNGYVSQEAIPAQDVFQKALTQDRRRDGKIEDEYFAASLNSKFEHANFARDQFRFVRDITSSRPTARGIVIRTAVQHMAFHRNDQTEAQVGRVHHEHRQNIVGARSTDFVDIFNELKEKWPDQKSKSNTLTYYGAVDTTADLFSAIAKESRVHPEILQDYVWNNDLNLQITIGDAAKAAIRWVRKTILYGPPVSYQQGRIGNILEKHAAFALPFFQNRIISPIDTAKAIGKVTVQQFLKKPREYFLESKRMNEKKGILFQNITDGGLSTMHTENGLEGVLGNFHKPIAYLEVQLGAIQALTLAQYMYPRKRTLYGNLAQKMRESVMRQFYMPEKQYFAAAVDRNETTNTYRKVETITLLGASILHSDLFDGMNDTEKEAYIAPVVKMLCSDAFLTDAGFRTKAKQYADAIQDPQHEATNAAEYQGSWTVWPALNEDIILGLRKQGLHKIAEQIENRLVNFVHANSNAEYAFVVPESVFVDGKKINLSGLVVQHYKTKEEFDQLSDEQKRASTGNKQVVFLAAPYPQGDQLWTASAVERIEFDRNHGKATQTQPNSWQGKIEQEIFQKENWKFIPIMDVEQLQNAKQSDYFFVIDAKKGAQLEEILFAQSEEKRNLLLRNRTRRS